jgi:hypothetical protein
MFVDFALQPRGPFFTKKGFLQLFITFDFFYHFMKTKLHSHLFIVEVP